MLLSVQGSGMAAGALAAWVKDAGCSQPFPAQGWHGPPGMSPLRGQQGPSLGPGRARDGMPCALQQGHAPGASRARWHRPTVPSWDIVSPSALSLASSLLVPKSSPAAGQPTDAAGCYCPCAFIHFFRGWGSQPPEPALPRNQFTLVRWSEDLTPRFKGRSRFPSLAACFHGDCPVLPAAMQPPACHRSDLLACAEGQVGNGLGRAPAPSRRGPRLSLCVRVEPTPREHPWGCRGIRDQPGSKRMRRRPPSGASLGIKCDQGPERDRGPAWVCDCMELYPSGASLGTTGDQGPAWLCVCVAISPWEHPWGPQGIRNQPGSVGMEPYPLEASLGTTGDQEPAWLCVCVAMSLGSVPGDRRGSGTSLPSPACCLPCCRWCGVHGGGSPMGPQLHPPPGNPAASPRPLGCPS